MPTSNTSGRGTRVLSIFASCGWTSAGSARLETPWRAGPTWSCRRRWATTAGLNVATSRAKCAVVLVASPKLFEPDCRTPRQMQRANAFCGYIELARLFGNAAMVLETDDGEPIRWLIVENASTEERRATGRPQLIDDHQAWAEREAVDLGNRLRLQTFTSRCSRQRRACMTKVNELSDGNVPSTPRWTAATTLRPAARSTLRYSMAIVTSSDLQIQLQTDARYASFIERAEPRAVLGLTLPVGFSKPCRSFARRFPSTF